MAARPRIVNSLGLHGMPQRKTENQKSRYWQVASGSGTRGYAKYFIRYGMAFVGGEAAIKSWAKIRQGDKVVLKAGSSKIVAVGEVSRTHPNWKNYADDEHSRGYEWLHDVDGWDLPAFAYVDWRVPKKPIPVSGLTRASLQRLHKPALIRAAEHIFQTAPEVSKSQPPMGCSTKVDDGIILESLISSGLRISGAEEVTHAFRQIRLLANYYKTQIEPSKIMEHETRTFLVIPLLLALGWSEQQIKIEYPLGKGRRVDIACFNEPFRGTGEDECRLLIETKGFGEGLDTAPEQARSYTNELPTSQTMVVTNGYAYKIYERTESGQFLDDPSAYLNVLDPREKYPIDHSVEGCIEALRILMPVT